MFKMGTGNWIKYGWGDSLKEEWSPDESLTMDYTEFDISKLSSDPISAAIEAVEEISKTYPGPYTLMCSGGVDSQAMIWAWHKAGVPFNIVSIRYISDGIFFNQHDLVQLDEFCSKYNFTVNYKDFDLINFLEVDLSEIALKYECASPQFCTHIKMSTLVEQGTIIYSGNYIMPTIVPIGYSLLGLQRYAEAENVKLIPCFFLHNPKLAHSFLNIIYDNTSPGNYDKPQPQYKIYQIAGFPVIRQPEKFNGFENIKKYYDKYFNRVKPIDRLKFASKPSKRVFDLLFRYPYEGAGKCKSSNPSVQKHNFKRGNNE